MNIIYYNIPDGSTWSECEKVMKTDALVSPFMPCQQSIHSLALLIRKKHKGVGRWLGMRAILLLNYPSKLVDRIIQLIFAPIVSVLCLCIETFQKEKVGGYPCWKKAVCILLLPFKIPVYMCINFSLYAVLLGISTLNIFSPLSCLIWGAKASQCYFLQYERLCERNRADEMDVQEQEDESLNVSFNANKENSSLRIRPHLKLPSSSNYNRVDLIDGNINLNESTANSTQENNIARSVNCLAKIMIL